MIATPLLDLEAPLPVPQPSRAWYAYPITIVTLGTAVFLAFVIAGDGGGSPLPPPLPVAAFVLAFWLQIVVHEGGHLVTGFARGFRFVSIAVWPVTVTAPEGRLSVRVRYGGSRRGLTLMVPPSDASRASFLAFSASGAVANAVAGAGGVAVFWALGGASIFDLRFGPMPHAPALAFSEASALCALRLIFLSVIPFRNGAYKSDGARLADEWANGERYARMRATLRLARAALHATSRAEIDPADLLAARRPVDGTRECLRGHLFAYACRRPEDLDEAGTDLEVALASSAHASPFEGKMLCLEAALYHAYVRRDGARARQWAERFGPDPIAGSSRIRLDIGLAWADGDVEGAIAAAEAARERLESALPEGHDRRLLEEALTYWLARFHDEARRDDAKVSG